MKIIKKIVLCMLVAIVVVGCKKESADNVNKSKNDTKPIIKKSSMIKIKLGSFQMGSNVGFDDNKPVHNVEITKDYFLCDHEVTQQEYFDVVGENPSFFQGEEHYEFENEQPGLRPVENVSWYEAIMFCNLLSMKENLTPCYVINGSKDPFQWCDSFVQSEILDNVRCDWEANGYRLPTEAEWEYAARSGNLDVDNMIFSGTDNLEQLNEYGWIGEKIATHQVKQKKANSNGLYDMSGNVWEWVWDCYPADGNYNYDADGVVDPAGVVFNTTRICRGGSYDQDKECAAVTTRFELSPYEYKIDIGFRIARNAN